MVTVSDWKKKVEEEEKAFWKKMEAEGKIPQKKEEEEE